MKRLFPVLIVSAAAAQDRVAGYVSGTTRIQAEFPDGKVIGRFEGTYSNR